MKKNDYKKYSPSTDLLTIETIDSILDIIPTHFDHCPKDLNILDIGCGIGSKSIPLSYLGYQVFGIDIHKPTIDDLNYNNKFKNARYSTIDGTEFSLKMKFDVVLCLGVLEHVSSYEKMLQNIKNHIAENGIAIINIPNGYCIYELLFSRLAQAVNFDLLFHRLPSPAYRLLTGSPSPRSSLNINNRHIQCFSFKQFKRILQKNGFHCLKSINLGLGIFLDWWWMKPLKYLECKIAPFVPGKIAGSWNFVVKIK